MNLRRMRKYEYSTHVYMFAIKYKIFTENIKLRAGEFSLEELVYGK